MFYKMKFPLIAIWFLCLTQAWAEPGLKNESELSTALVSGNSNTETYGIKQLSTFEWEQNAIKANGRYIQGRNNGVESARAWDASLRYERALSDVWSTFVAQTIESDIYAGFVQRNSTDIGAKYFFTKNDSTVFFAEAGYRYIHTDYVTRRPEVENYTHAGRLYSEITHKFNESVSGKYWAEYVPQFKDKDAYFINTEPSVTAILSQIFSLKSSYLVKYQNPNKANVGLRSYTDTTFLTSLVAKF
jgi:putative salt-induced outer membrane protein